MAFAKNSRPAPGNKYKKKQYLGRETKKKENLNDPDANIEQDDFFRESITEKPRDTSKIESKNTREPRNFKKEGREFNKKDQRGKYQKAKYTKPKDNKEEQEQEQEQSEDAEIQNQVSEDENKNSSAADAENEAPARARRSYSNTESESDLQLSQSERFSRDQQRKKKPLTFQERIQKKKERKEAIRARKIENTKQKIDKSKKSQKQREYKKSMFQDSKTKHGQPIMGPRINNLLEQIKKLT
ncbi:hypothetical protein B5S31_g65 [[Candida] boidinii]|nr:hypothetical protein B5S29_g132 [[Candida] boidinii]OWB70388.1 hypothetical protein B5S31_g65 [[Candida] boidinii]OWB76019.1 hypothetical protein B5S32_g166 [[Candida] boidinii]